MVETIAASNADIVARRALEQSGVFDAQAYSAARSLPANADPIADYLHGGWQAGMEPSAALECGWLYPY